MTKLKPCPFCGGVAHTYKNNLWWAACETPYCATVGACLTEQEVIDKWNTRTRETTTLRDGVCVKCGRVLKETCFSERVEVSTGIIEYRPKKPLYCPSCGRWIDHETA